MYAHNLLMHFLYLDWNISELVVKKSLEIYFLKFSNPVMFYMIGPSLTAQS